MCNTVWTIIVLMFMTALSYGFSWALRANPQDSQYQAVLVICGLGLLLQVAVSAWVIITINRMLRTQMLALGLMEALSVRSGFKVAIDKIQAQAATTNIRKDDLENK